MTDAEILDIARHYLPGEWTRADLQRVLRDHAQLDVKNTKAGEIIKGWKTAGHAYDKDPRRYTYAWTDEPDSVSRTAQTDGQMPPHAPARAREEPAVSLRDAAIGFRVLAVVALALVVLLPLGAALLNWRPAVVEHPANVPDISPTFPATSTPEPRTIPAYWAPGGAYAGDVALPQPGDVVAHWGASWVNVGTPEAPRWVRAGDWLGVDFAQVPDLAPTPTARVQVVYQQVPVHIAPPAPAPVPTAAPQPTPAPQPADVVQVSEEPRILEPGGSYLVCHPTEGCACSAISGPYKNDWRVVLSDISRETCEREAGW
jgi:hypothetical protein